MTRGEIEPQYLSRTIADGEQISPVLVVSEGFNCAKIIHSQRLLSSSPIGVDIRAQSPS